MNNVFWSIIQNFFNKGFSLVFSVILGNILLPEEMGLYFSLLMVVNYAVSLLSFQIGNSIVQKLNDVKIKHLNDHYFSSGLVLNFVIAFLVVTGLYLLNPVLTDLFQITNQSNLLLIILPLIAVQMTRDYLSGVLRARLLLRELAIIFLLIRVIQVGSVLVVLRLGYGLTGVIASIYIGETLAVIMLGVTSLRQFKIVFPTELGTTTLHLFQFGVKLQVVMIATFLNKNIDAFFVNFYLSKEQLAYYTYASKFALMFLLFSNSISTVTYPLLTKAFSSNKESESNSIYSLSIKLSFLLLSTTSLILIYHFGFLVNLILPAEYIHAKLPLIILLGGLIVFSSFATVGTIFSSRGTPGLSAVSSWVGLIVILIMGPWVIPEYGIAGAAATMAVSFLVRMIVGMTMVEKIVHLKFTHGRFFLSYLIFLLTGIVGNFNLEQYWLRDILVIIYSLIVFFILLGRAEKVWIYQKFDRWRESRGSIL